MQGVLERTASVGWVQITRAVSFAVLARLEMWSLFRRTNGPTSEESKPVHTTSVEDSRPGQSMPVYLLRR